MIKSLTPLPHPSLGRGFVFLSRQQEERHLKTLDPFRAETPCVKGCGSYERVYNLRREVACRRCGTPQ